MIVSIYAVETLRIQLWEYWSLGGGEAGVAVVLLQVLFVYGCCPQGPSHGEYRTAKDPAQTAQPWDKNK